MAKITKRAKALQGLVVPGKAYAVEDALRILKDNSKVKAWRRARCLRTGADA